MKSLQGRNAVETTKGSPMVGLRVRIAPNGLWLFGVVINVDGSSHYAKTSKSNLVKYFEQFTFLGHCRGVNVHRPAAKVSGVLHTADRCVALGSAETARYFDGTV